MVHSGYDLVENFFESRKEKNPETWIHSLAVIYILSLKEHSFSNAGKALKYVELNI